MDSRLVTVLLALAATLGVWLEIEDLRQADQARANATKEAREEAHRMRMRKLIEESQRMTFPIAAFQKRK